VSWLIPDRQGTGQVAIDAATQTLTRRRYTPFGQERGTQQTWRGDKGFVGGTPSVITGMTHLGAREYDPATGRFASLDPVFDGGDPQSWNGYAYGDNNPVTVSDPSGLKVCDGGSGPDACPTMQASVVSTR
jgi:RHS repeat-associated protein